MNYIKHILKNHLKAVLSLLFLIVFATTLHTFAIVPEGGYAPGETLNPDCLPGADDCVVTIPSDYWSLTGDAGTVDDGTYFIGTTDEATAVPLNFKVDGQKAGRIDSTLNNTFFGYQSGFSNTTGVQNTFIGTSAGYSNLTGEYNTITGAGAGYFNTAGNNNVFSGYRTGFSNTLGSGNTFLGYATGMTNATGGNNTILGATADVAANDTTGAIALGAGAIAATNEFALPDTITNWKFQGESYTLPTAFGAADSVLTDAAGDGVLSWAAAGGGTTYDVYYALLTQAGTDPACGDPGDPYPANTCAPQVTELENTIGDIVWTRTNLGNYIGTLTGAFPLGSTAVSIQNAPQSALLTIIYLNDEDSFTLQVQDIGSGGHDDALWNTPVEIRVYP